MPWNAQDEQLVTLAEAGLLTTRLRASATRHTVVLVATDSESA